MGIKCCCLAAQQQHVSAKALKSKKKKKSTPRWHSGLKGEKNNKVQSSFLWDLNSATNVRPDVLLCVHRSQMFPRLRLDNHYAYQKHFIKEIRSESEGGGGLCLCIYYLCFSLCMYFSSCVCLSLHTGDYRNRNAFLSSLVLLIH